jgi:hypothetical protein
MKLMLASLTLTLAVALSIQTTSAIDLDGDGMSDVWEKLYDPNNALNPDADADADGFTNLFESLAGTDPHDASDFLTLNLERVPQGLAITWDEQLGKQYVLESSDNLQTWSELDVLEPIGFLGESSSTPPPPGGSQTDFLDSWHIWNPGYGGFDRQWASLYSFEANAGYPNYGFYDHLDGDSQPNFVESYTGTNPGATDGHFEPWLDLARARLRFEYYDTSGDLRYDLEFAVSNSSFYSSANITGSPFENHATALDPEFYGSVIDHRTEPARLRSFVPDQEIERATPDYIPPDQAITAVELDFSEAEFHDAGSGDLLIEWPATAAHDPIAIIVRGHIGDWFYGRIYEATVHQAQTYVGGESNPNARDFYRITASDSFTSNLYPNLWERYAMQKGICSTSCLKMLKNLTTR